MRSARPIAMAAILTLSTVATSHADLVINASYGISITSDPNAATIEATIAQAIQTYESTITTPITVKIAFAEMTTGLGQSSTSNATISYKDFHAALLSHASSVDDATANATLTSLTVNPVNGRNDIQLSTANLRALGFVFFPSFGAADSTISLNTSQMNLDRTSTNPSKYDLLAVVQHEINEALGLGSSLDSGNTAIATKPEDLFRYSAPSVRSYDTSTASTAYFSIDGGVTNVVGFNQSGGGADYGDWASSATIRVQDAFGTPGSAPDFGSAERTALDVIGYNFHPSLAVPEPSSLVMVALGLAAVGFRPRARPR